MDNSKIRRLAIGSRVKELRKILDLSQQELADKVEVNKSTISNLETGNKEVSSKILDNVSLALESTRVYLETGDPKTSDKLYDLIRFLSEPERRYFINQIKEYLEMQAQRVDFEDS